VRVWIIEAFLNINLGCQMNTEINLLSQNCLNIVTSRYASSSKLECILGIKRGNIALRPIPQVIHPMDGKSALK
jgi:hypothetical protein